MFKESFKLQSIIKLYEIFARENYHSILNFFLAKFWVNFLINIPIFAAVPFPEIFYLIGNVPIELGKIHFFLYQWFHNNLDLFYLSQYSFREKFDKYSRQSKLRPFSANDDYFTRLVKRHYLGYNITDNFRTLE